MPQSSIRDYSPSIDFARELDAVDPLRAIRSRFHIPTDTDDNALVYFAGNSLGLQPVTAAGYIENELEDWKKLGVEGHLHARQPWLPYHELVTEPSASIVGAKPLEVVVMNSLTVNLHLLLATFYRPTEHRYKIVIEGDAFPSDSYAVASQAAHHGFDPVDTIIRLRPRPGETLLRTEDILETIERHGPAIAVILLGGVNYYTGQFFDLEAVTRAGHDAGCYVGFDLAHAAGNVALSLHDWDVDFAAWCSYKYLNSGPGGIAGVYIHEQHALDTSLPRFAGWWGHDKSTRFEMPERFSPIRSAEGWQLSNPPIFQLASLRASLDIFSEAGGMDRLTAKSQKLTGFLEYLMKQIPGVRVITPEDPGQRGCQLSIRISSSGRRVFESLHARNVICDWREPDVIRAAPVPLYNTFEDVFTFYKVFESLVSK